MKNIKSFNENWSQNLKNKLLKPINDKFLKNRTSYLTQFKFDFEKRTKPVNILIECLYYIEFLKNSDNRFLGAAEGVLLMEDFLKQGQKLDYKQKDEKFLFIKYKTKEDYRDVIIRYTKEYLTQKGIL